MKHLLIVALLVAAPLAGCLTLVDEQGGQDGAGDEPRLEPHETDDPEQLAANRNVLYLHSEGPEETWMSVDADATDTSLTAPVSSFGDEPWFSFMTATPLDRSLNMTGADAEATISFEANVGTAGMAPVVKARLFVEGEQVSAGEHPNSFSGAAMVPLALPAEVEAGSDIRLDVCLCPGMATFAPQAVLHTDGSSFLTLPIETPVYVDLASRDGEDDAGDEDATSDVAGRDETPVTARRSDGRWVASKTVTLTGGLDGLTAVQAEFSTVNGGITMEGRSDSGYQVVVELEGIGETEKDARERLSKLRVEHDDGTSAGAKHLAVAVQSTDKWRNQTGRIHAALPAAATYTGLSAETVNGPVEVVGLSAGDVSLASVNGPVDLTDVRLVNIVAATTNGLIRAQVESVADGSYDLSTTNGAIEVSVPDGTRHGYDAEANNVNAAVSIDLADTQAVGSQSAHHKHVRTTDYDTRQVKVGIEAQTVNGAIDIVGS